MLYIYDIKNKCYKTITKKYNRKLYIRIEYIKN